MCENCRDVLIDYRGRPHDTLQCPLLSISYCGLCSRRGHFHGDCPDAGIKRMQKPLYLEQLIPPSLRERYKIVDQKTPLAVTDPDPPKIPESVWELPANGKYIKEFLKDFEPTLQKLSLTIKTNGEAKKENMMTVVKLAAALKKQVIWIKSKRKEEENEADTEEPKAQAQQLPQTKSKGKAANKKA